MVLGKPKVAVGVAGMNIHDAAIVGGKHEVPGGAASVIGVRAKLPTPEIAKPLADTGQAEDPAWMARLVASR